MVHSERLNLLTFLDDRFPPDIKIRFEDDKIFVTRNVDENYYVIDKNLYFKIIHYIFFTFDFTIFQEIDRTKFLVNSEILQ